MSMPMILMVAREDQHARRRAGAPGCRTDVRPGHNAPHPRGGDVSRSLRFMPVTKTERRVAKTLALEPGGPPTAQARIAGQVIKALFKTGWRCRADSPA